MNEKQEKAKLNPWPLHITPKCKSAPKRLRAYRNRIVFISSLFADAIISFTDGSPFEKDEYEIKKGSILFLTVNNDADGQYGYDVKCTNDSRIFDGVEFPDVDEDVDQGPEDEEEKKGRERLAGPSIIIKGDR